ncbi:MAG: hypothetical protein WA936_08500 [Erythrobacter sp.]|uniref:hypothetical protein n=1 Tax=Erythrobacter sp. TaxID=1042 RepID=UPI003C77F8D7
MQPLMLHRECDLGPIRAVTAGITATPNGFKTRFHLDGPADRIALPAKAPSARADDLWKTTCCEVFWQPVGGAPYYEFNFSPSGQWAAYAFDSYRENMQDLPVDAISVAPSIGDRAVSLQIEVVADLPAPAQVGLSAVVQHEGGDLQYWALAFGPGRPDFHSEACRQLIVERPDL